MAIDLHQQCARARTTVIVKADNELVINLKMAGVTIGGIDGGCLGRKEVVHRKLPFQVISAASV